MKKKHLNNPWIISFVTSGSIAILSVLISSIWAYFGNVKFLTIFLSFWTTKIQLWQIVISLILVITIGLLLRKKPKKFKYKDEQIQLDRRVFQKIQEIIPSDGSIDFIRDYNFSSSFRSADLSDIRKITYEQRMPEFYFLHPELENLRVQLIELSDRLIRLLANKTYPTGADRQEIPREWKIDQPEIFNEIVDNIHNLTTDICETYDKLIKTGREILKT